MRSAGKLVAEQTESEWLSSDDPRDPNMRFRVEREVLDDGLISLYEEEVHTQGPRARIKEIRGAMDFTPKEAYWIAHALLRAVGPRVR